MLKPPFPFAGLASRFLKGVALPATGLVAAPTALVSRTACTSVSMVINHLLAQHRNAKEKLQRDAGKVVQIQVAPVSISLRVSDQGFFVPSHPVNGVSAPADTSIVMQWSDLAGAVASPGSINRKAKIEGDMDFAQVVATTLNNLAWDPERDLARIVGDAQAVWIMSTLAALGTNVKDVVNRFKSNLREYVVYEKAISPSADEFDAFRNEVNRLRDDLARLEKRLKTVDPQGSA